MKLKNFGISKKNYDQNFAKSLFKISLKGRFERLKYYPIILIIFHKFIEIL